jgi:hypothetical protein
VGTCFQHVSDGCASHNKQSCLDLHSHMLPPAAADLAGKLLPGCVLPNVSSFEWSADGSCLYYCAPDDLGRPSKVRGSHSRPAGLLTHALPLSP